MEKIKYFLINKNLSINGSRGVKVCTMSGKKMGSAEWAEWYDSKCINFLRFLQQFTEKVCAGLNFENDPITEAIGNKSKSLLENQQERAIIFSALARKQMVAKVPMVSTFTLKAKDFYNSDPAGQEAAYNSFVELVEDHHRKVGKLVDYIKDNQEENLPDIVKLCGYISLFFGELV